MGGMVHWYRMGKRPTLPGLRLTEVVLATGLNEETIRRLDRKGIIQSTRDGNGWRIFPPSVVPFLRRRYLLSAATVRQARTPMEREIEAARLADSTGGVPLDVENRGAIFRRDRHCNTPQ